MKYTSQQLVFLKKINQRKYFSFKNFGKIPNFLQKKTIFFRKGIFFRKLFIIDLMVNRHLGSYLVSRKPFSRVFLKKRR